jgi:hypothetical protein
VPRVLVLQAFSGHLTCEVLNIVSSNTKMSDHLINTQFLLVLWDEGGAEIRKGVVNKRFSGRVAAANVACAGLVEAGKIVLSPDGKRLTLTAAGKNALKEDLAGSKFEFGGQIGAKLANALLKWFRSGVGPVGGAKVAEPIGSYEVFKGVALEIFDRLDRDFNMDNLVPIYRIRREIGERVSRSEFNEFLLKIQTEKILRLQGGSVEDSSLDKIADSISTEVSGLRCFVTRP